MTSIARKLFNQTVKPGSFSPRLPRPLRHTLLAIFLGAALASRAAHAQSDSTDLASELGFQVLEGDKLPAGWDATPEGVMFDDSVLHEGRRTLRLESGDASLFREIGLYKSLPVDFSAKKIELKVWIKTENVQDFAGVVINSLDSKDQLIKSME